MATKLSRPNALITEKATTWMRDKMLAGHFPQVEYRESETQYGGCVMRGYNMMEYSKLNSRVLWVINDKIKKLGYEYGIWQNARSASFNSVVENVIGCLTVEEITESAERFKTWMD